MPNSSFYIKWVDFVVVTVNRLPSLKDIWYSSQECMDSSSPRTSSFFFSLLDVRAWINTDSDSWGSSEMLHHHQRKVERLLVWNEHPENQNLLGTVQVESDTQDLLPWYFRSESQGLSSWGGGWSMLTPPDSSETQPDRNDTFLFSSGWLVYN